MTHLLVTNDFPPKLGGIQSYLWELWRRLPADEVVVLTTPHDGARAFDAEQAYRVERTRERVLLPTRSLGRRIDALAAEVDATIVLLDPALPVGHLGPRLERPYGIILHGAEVTIPGRTWPGKPLLRRVLRDARLVIAAGPYPLREGARAAGRELPAVDIPPGVDTKRFVPLDDVGRRAARARFGFPADRPVLVSVSRLVPRKGMDVVIRAATELRGRHPDLVVAIAGAGRDRPRLDKLAAASGADVRFLGRVADEDLPALYGAADLFVMLCRDRWLGLEQEGFGIVFLEAAACGVAQIAGSSGGSADAVDDGVSGLVVAHPRDAHRAAAAIDELLTDVEARRAMGAAARTRAVACFDYDVLAGRLAEAIVRAAGPADA